MNCSFLETLVSPKVKDVNSPAEDPGFLHPSAAIEERIQGIKKSVIVISLEHPEADVQPSHKTRNQCYFKSSPLFHQLFLLPKSSIPVRSAALFGSLEDTQRSHSVPKANIHFTMDLSFPTDCLNCQMSRILLWQQQNLPQQLLAFKGHLRDPHCF